MFLCVDRGSRFKCKNGNHKITRNNTKNSTISITETKRHEADTLIHSFLHEYGFASYKLPDLRILFGFALIFLFQFSLLAQTSLSESPDGKTLEVNDAPEMQVFAISKTVVIKKHAKEVFAFGGDVIIEGVVEGDVGAIGGSVIQKDGASIGGDVIVIGGSYKPETSSPIRAEGKQTMVFGVFEEELRNLGQNPSQIFSPSLTPAFFAQRILSVLFWFVVTLIITTIAPGAVSRAIARIQLSSPKIIGLGLIGFIFTFITVGIVAKMGFLPDYLSVVFGLMAFALLVLAYVFGRVTLHLSIGKLVQKQFLGQKASSETLAIFIGVLIWTMLLSIPYLWTLALLTMFSAGVGLVLTARTPAGWRSS